MADRLHTDHVVHFSFGPARTRDDVCNRGNAGLRRINFHIQRKEGFVGVQGEQLCHLVHTG
jgi:hypothetical protein